ncbi:MAG: HAMP domain-containing histidine kinase [Clostridiales bacterium]|nr:HAMP domain-containing histidine kinase [Clostridiales bacterium]
MKAAKTLMLFKKLRNSMMLFNMLTVSFVTLTAFAVIYFTTYMNIERENARKLEFASTMLYPRGNAPRIGYDPRRRPPADTQPPESPEERYELILAEIANSRVTLNELLLTLIAIAAFVLIALMFVSYYFAVRAVRPIEEGYNKQKQFIADASHELRTPLAVIGANVDAIVSSGNETVDSQKEWFGYIRAELKRTGKLVDDLLYLAKSENIMREDSFPFDLSAVCETVCASMEAALYDAGKFLKTDITSGVTITADSEKITQALYILLDNAGKYTPQGGEIAVSLIKESDKAVIRVMNIGDGISPDDLPRIFDRFYRADSSRSAETGGYGLGLSIAKTIAENSGGTIAAESANGVTIFEIKLRRKKTIPN